MSTIHFTSDLHFGHHKVAELRGFDDAQTHDYTIADRWNSVVGRNDTVWVLGDLTMDMLDHSLDLISRLNGTKHLISGNHDVCHPMFRTAHKYQRKYLGVFESVASAARVRIAKQEVLLSHFPYLTGDGEADHTNVPREGQWRLRNEGRWLLHGHTHKADQRRHGSQIHVGLDAWDLKPVEITTIADLMKDPV